MHGENSNIWDKYRSLRTYAVWAGERAFAFAKRINHSLAFAQNRGFCAKRRHNAQKEQGGLCTACAERAFVSTR